MPPFIPLNSCTYLIYIWYLISKVLGDRNMPLFMLTTIHGGLFLCISPCELTFGLFQSMDFSPGGWNWGYFPPERICICFCQGPGRNTNVVLDLPLPRSLVYQNFRWPFFAPGFRLNFPNVMLILSFAFRVTPPFLFAPWIVPFLQTQQHNKNCFTYNLIV